MARLFVIRFECDRYGDHSCDTEQLCDVQDATFSDKVDALHFMGECTSPIKNIFVVDNANSEEIPFEVLLQAEEDRRCVEDL